MRRQHHDAGCEGEKYYNVKDVREEPLSDTILIQQLGTQAYAIVPLISRDKGDRDHMGRQLFQPKRDN